MSCSIMTDAGLALFARALQEGFTVPVDRMLFADIPGLDTDAEPSPETMRPAAETIVHEGVITNAGKLDANQVIYSYVLPATLGPFYINWIGLYSTQYETLIAIYHVPRHYKSNTSGFQVGNTLYKNFAIQYENIGDLSGITVPPESWQYDFDDRYALKNHNHDTKYEPLGCVSEHNQAAAAHKTLFDAKAPLASPALTGTPTVPTAAAGTNTTQAASTAFVTTAVNNAKITVDSALSGTSTNPVQNKVINTALAAKAASSHTHSYLPLAGGTMTGSITRDGLLAQNGVSGSNISINGGTGGMNHGGTLGLYDKNHTSDGGCFILRASKDGVNYKDLRGAPDGTLTWMGKSLLGDDVITTWQSSDKKSWYRKYASGWIEQGGYVGASATSVTYPVAFADTNYCILRTRHTTNGNDIGDDGQNVRSVTTTGFTMSNGYAPSYGSWWFACGYAAS